MELNRSLKRALSRKIRWMMDLGHIWRRKLATIMLMLYMPTMVRPPEKPCGGKLLLILLRCYGLGDTFMSKNQDLMEAFSAPSTQEVISKSHYSFVFYFFNCAAEFL
ncbi:hypothetical protein GW17_00057286 [Ensete ventricosum]|nr:hypothetical protein GW17_00057286 [Ensete ventricosum]